MNSQIVFIMRLYNSKERFHKRYKKWTYGAEKPVGTSEIQIEFYVSNVFRILLLSVMYESVTKQVLQ